MGARYAIHKMIQDLMRDEKNAAAFGQDPEPFYVAYGLTDDEKASLRDGSAAALHHLGVHPNLQFKLLRLRAGTITGAATADRRPMAAYLDRIMER